MAAAPAAVPVALVAAGIGGAVLGTAALVSGATVATIALVNLMNPFHVEDEDLTANSNDQPDICDINIHFVQLKFSRSAFMHTAVFIERISENGTVVTRFLYEVNGTDAGICEILHAVNEKVLSSFKTKVLVSSLADFSWNRFVHILRNPRLMFYSLFDQNCRHFCLKVLEDVRKDFSAGVIADKVNEAVCILNSTIVKDKLARTMFYPLAVALSRSDASKSGAGNNKNLLAVLEPKSKSLVFHFALKVDSFDPDVPSRGKFVARNGQDMAIISKIKKAIIKNQSILLPPFYCDCCQLEDRCECPRKLISKMLEGGYTPGVLLCGPPGIGKSALINVVCAADAADFTIFKVSTELIDCFMADASARVELLFDMAQCYAPSILIFDDVEDLFSDPRVCAVLRHRMDALICAPRKVIVLASSTNPWNVDHALLSRFIPFCIKLPSAARRCLLLRSFNMDRVVHADFSFEELADLLEGYSPRDLANLTEVAKASVGVSSCPLTYEAFREASRIIRPTVSTRLREIYDQWSSNRDCFSKMQETPPPYYKQY